MRSCSSDLTSIANSAHSTTASDLLGSKPRESSPGRVLVIFAARRVYNVEGGLEVSMDKVRDEEAVPPLGTIGADCRQLHGVVNRQRKEAAQDYSPQKKKRRISRNILLVEVFISLYKYYYY